MNATKVLRLLLAVVLVVWGAEALFLVERNRVAPERIRAEEAQRRRRIELDFRERLREQEREYGNKEHLATGNTPFDRIFNTQDQNLVDLLTRISLEALPAGWTCDVKVEEFTHFILLVYLPQNSQRPPLAQVVAYIQPIAEYCGPYLSDIAVFDGTHKSYLFLNRFLLTITRDRKDISEFIARRAEEQGAAFTRFNSVTIK